MQEFQFQVISIFSLYLCCYVGEMRCRQFCAWERDVWERGTYNGVDLRFIICRFLFLFFTSSYVCLQNVCIQPFQHDKKKVHENLNPVLRAIVHKKRKVYMMYDNLMI